MHIFKQRILYFSLLLLGPTLLAAQEQKQEGLEALVKARRLDSLIEFRAECINRDEFSYQLNARIVILRKQSEGAIRDSTSTGKFTVSPESELLLFSTTIHPKDLPSFGLILEILQGGALVSVASFPKDLHLTRTTSQDEPAEPNNLDLAGGAVKQDPDINGSSLNLNGFIVESTLTPAGQEFTQLFSNKWQNQNLPGDYTIKIEELPFRGRSTQLILYLNDEEIFRRFIQPSYEFLDQLSTALVRYIAEKVRSLNQTQRDLDGDLKGSGIF